MHLFFAESSLPLPFLDGAEARHLSSPSPLEADVIALFNELRNPLLRYLLSFGLTPHDGEEVVQEVFLALFLHLQRGKSRSNLRGWIFRVGHNLALKQRLRDSRISLRFANSAEVDQQLDSTPDPEQQLTHSQWQHQLQKIVHALPEQDRCCLILRAEGLRYREIAEALGMSLGGVSLSLSRTMGLLMGRK